MWIIFPLVFLAGFVDSIAGGGGLISLPAYMAAGLPAHMALGTNKFSAVIGTGISTVRFAKNGNMRWDVAAYSFFGALIGSAIGANIALLVNERNLKLIMLFAIPCVAFFMFTNKGFRIKEEQPSAKALGLCSVLIGVSIGAYDGFFGPGTGTFLILAFTSVLGLPLLTSCGNAKAVNFASNIAAAITFIYSGSVNYKIGIPCMFCGILGNYIGSGLAMKKGAKIVRPMMLAVICFLIIKIIWDLKS